MIAHVGDTEVLTVLGALGERPLPEVGQWAIRPDVPPPDECPPRPHMNNFEDTIRSRLDERMAAGRPFFELDGTEGNGTSAIWVRLPELLEMSAATRSRSSATSCRSGIGQALGVRAGGNSLDNTLRVAQLEVPTDWVLADIRVHAVARPASAHGLVHLWARRRRAARHREPVHDRACVG